MITCKNCETEFKGNFCPNCAQSAKVHRLTIGHIAHEVAHEATHIDGGALLLLRKVMYVPGHVARDYIEGKRKRYFNPFTLLVVLIALMVIVSNKTNIYSDFTQKIKQFTTDVMKKTAGNGALKTGNLNEDLKNVEKTMDEAEGSTKKALNNSKLINFIFLPIMSLLTWLFFRKSKYNYAENLVFNVLVACGYTSIFLIVLIPLYLLFPSQVILLMYLYILVLVIFSIAAYRQFYQQSRTATILKGIAVQVIYMAIVSISSPWLTSLL
ncbi:MAG: DUF3667 domain-containing protein [Bacteroidota bacterium]